MRIVLLLKNLIWLFKQNSDGLKHRVVENESKSNVIEGKSLGFPLKGNYNLDRKMLFDLDTSDGVIKYMKSGQRCTMDIIDPRIIGSIKRQLIQQKFTYNQLYHLFRYADIKKDDLNSYEKALLHSQYVLWLIATFNRSGYVREEALKLILEQENAEAHIRYVLFRLVDWVSSIAVLAQKFVLCQLTVQNVPLFIEHMDVIVWLKHSNQKIAQETYAHIQNFLNCHANVWMEYFDELNPKVQLTLVTMLMQIESVSSEILDTLSHHKNTLVSRKVQSHPAFVESLSDEECIALIYKNPDSVNLALFRA